MSIQKTPIEAGKLLQGGEAQDGISESGKNAAEPITGTWRTGLKEPQLIWVESSE